MSKGKRNSPATGFEFAMKGMRLISRPGLRRYVMVPFLVNLVVFGGLIWLGADQFEGLLDRWLPEESWLSYFRWILWPLFAVAFLLIVFVLNIPVDSVISRFGFEIQAADFRIGHHLP